MQRATKQLKIQGLKYIRKGSKGEYVCLTTQSSGVFWLQCSSCTLSSEIYLLTFLNIKIYSVVSDQLIRYAQYELSLSGGNATYTAQLHLMPLTIHDFTSYLYIHINISISIYIYICIDIYIKIWDQYFSISKKQGWNLTFSGCGLWISLHLFKGSMNVECFLQVSEQPHDVFVS